jgi:hypothetical protein
MSVPDRPPPLLADPFVTLQRHRALVGAGVYLFVSAIGALYYSLLLGEFGLDAFDYWEASDFLLAVFREPIALVFGLMALLLWFSLNYQRTMNDWMYGKLPWLGRLVRYQRWRESRFWNESPGFFATTAFALVWFVIVMGSIASSTARNAQLGKADQVTLELSDGSTLRGVLLTATNRYLFVVVPTPEQEAVRLRVVPYDALAWVESCGARRGLLRTMTGQARECAKLSAPAAPSAAAGSR